MFKEKKKEERIDPESSRQINEKVQSHVKGWFTFNEEMSSINFNRLTSTILIVEQDQEAGKKLRQEVKLVKEEVKEMQNSIDTILSMQIHFFTNKFSELLDDFSKASYISQMLVIYPETFWYLRNKRAGVESESIVNELAFSFVANKSNYLLKNGIQELNDIEDLAYSTEKVTYLAEENDDPSLLIRVFAYRLFFLEEKGHASEALKSLKKLERDITTPEAMSSLKDMLKELLIFLFS